MPRKVRFYLPGVPCHVVQRGHNRKACFSRPADFEYYLRCLREACVKYEALVHAYVLMTNHVHLLVTPLRAEAISRVLQSVGRCYVRYFNLRHRRSGTLWEGRHKASLVDSDHYFLRCHRYIELNPVRAGMVPEPGSYRWSSYHANALGREDGLTRHHDVYLALAGDAAGRRSAYQDLFQEQLDAGGLDEFRGAINLCVPVGGERFKAEVERRLKVPISYKTRGRPRVADLAGGASPSGASVRSLEDCSVPAGECQAQ